MKLYEPKRCIRCGAKMQIVEGSDRTMRGKVYFTLRCRNCNREEVDWCDRKFWCPPQE